MLKNEIKNLAFGGQGITHTEGQVTFIPFTAPGDTITYRITHKKKNFSQGELVEILAKSPHRIDPSCPYFGKCGGCQLQHLAYETQLDHKRSCVEEALQRIGHLPATVLPTIAARQWGYRRHITLSLKSSGAGFEAGYIAMDNKTLIPIDQCPIFLDTPHRIIPHVQEIASQLKYSEGNEGKISLFKQGDAQFILYFQFKTLPQNCKDILKGALNSFCIGILASSPQKTFSWGQTTGVLHMDAWQFHFSPKVFIQNHAEQSLNIYRQILAQASSRKAQNILDLYCGIGISSLLLAKHHLHVTGVEANPHAIHFARKNSKINQIKNATFIQADVHKILPQLLHQFHSPYVIVNPPRTGLDSRVIHSLMEQPPPVILYISCMPTTLARDLRILCKERFKLNFVQPYDMFPQTSHVETLAVIESLSA